MTVGNSASQGGEQHPSRLSLPNVDSDRDPWVAASPVLINFSWWVSTLSLRDRVYSFIHIIREVWVQRLALHFNEGGIVSQ